MVAHLPAERRPTQKPDTERRPPMGVLDQLSQAAIKRSAPFEISEARLNEHLRRVVGSRADVPGGGEWWRMEAPELDLEEGRAELRLRWLLAERHVCDLTVNLKLAREAEVFRVEVVDGAYGRLAVPRGLLHPVKGVLAELAEVLRPELEALFAMNRLSLAEDRLVVDPRFTDPSAQASATP